MTRVEAFYATAAAAANVIGALAVTSRTQWSVQALDTMLSLAAGYMIAVSLLDLFPESYERLGHTAALVVLLGYLLVHITQHTLARHFHFGEETHEVSKIVSMSALIGLLLHTFVDGVAIASGTSVSEALGAMVFIAVLLHKFPEGLAISSLFLAAGASRRRAILAAGALGLATFLGVLITESFGWLSTYGLPLAAGVTLYVGASNLVPEVQSRHGWRMPLAFLSGVALYFLARTLAHG